MTSHLLKQKPGPCLACGAAYSDTEHPGPAFYSVRSWSLSHDRCKLDSVAIGTLDNPTIINVDDKRNLYPGEGKPEGEWPHGETPK